MHFLFSQRWSSSDLQSVKLSALRMKSRGRVPCLLRAGGVLCRFSDDQYSNDHSRGLRRI